MILKQDILSTYSENKSYAETARAFSVSKQYVFQIVKNYKNTGRNGRKEIYDFVYEPFCEKCKKNKTTAIHHIDDNNQNDNPINLMPLCKRCHYEIHNKMRRDRATRVKTQPTA